MKKISLKPGVVTDIPIDRIIPDASQPRETFLAKPLEDLANNIRERGVRQPITVVPSGAHQFLIKTGERRWRASKLAGKKTVPCLLDVAGTDEPGDLMLDQLAENELREGLNPIERAKAFQRLRDAGLGPKDISERLAAHGMKLSRPAVSNTLRLLKLPEGAQDLVKAGTLKESYARLLVPYVEYPDVIAAICKDVVTDPIDYVDEDYVLNTIEYQLEEAGGAVRLNDKDGCENCSCMVSTGSKSHKANWCMDAKKIEAKRAEASPAAAASGSASQPPKKKETDPTKVKPAKVTANDDGVVATNRRSWSSFKHLSPEDMPFYADNCEGCPHNHLASHNGNPDQAEPTCFYMPCFENLQRQQRKIDNRLDTIRELIDEQLLPCLIETMAREPVSSRVVMPLLAYVAAGYPVMPIPQKSDFVCGGYAGPERHYSNGRSTDSQLRNLPSVLSIGTLTKFLQTELKQSDIDQVVEACIRAIDLEQRRELALYGSIDISSFWRNTPEYAALFTKPEIQGLIGDNFDGPDVPAGEWRQRLAETAGVPELVRELWTSDIANHQALDLFDDDDDVDQEEAA